MAAKRARYCRSPTRPVDFALRWETAVRGVCFAADRPDSVATLDPICELRAARPLRPLPEANRPSRRTSRSDDVLRFVDACESARRHAGERDLAHVRGRIRSP